MLFFSCACDSVPFDCTLIPYVSLLCPTLFLHSISVTLSSVVPFHHIIPRIQQCLLLEFLFVPDASGHGVLLSFRHVMPVGHGHGLRLPPRTLPPSTLPLGILPLGALPPRTLPPRTLPPRTLPPGILP